MKKRMVLTSAVLAILLVGSLAQAASAESPRFSIAPASADAARSGTFFSFDLAPGSTINDAALVRNDGSEPLVLALYAADAITATNGGTAFTARGGQRDGSRAWLSTTTASELRLPAGAQTVVPFTIRVPADATPGDHVAGWVVEAAPVAQAQGGSTALVVQRAGVAVVIRVPGPATEKLMVGELCLNQQSGSNYFQVVVANQGGLITKARGAIVLRDGTGRQIFQRPVDLGAVMPRDSAFVRLDSPVELPEGSYLASIALTQSDGTPASFEGRIAVGGRKANGCVKADEQPAPLAPAIAVVNLPSSPSSSSGADSSMVLIAAAAAAAAAGAGLFAGWLLARRPR